jgi:hypothetical protein
MTGPPALRIVTVGRSLLDRLDASLPHLRDVLLPSGPNPLPVADMLRDLAVEGDIDPAALLADDDESTAIRTAEWKLAAEWTSLAVHPATSGPAVYLASDTDVGLRAATLLALRHTTQGTGYGGVVRYVHDINHGPPIADHVDRVTVVRVPGLDFRSPGEANERTWHALGQLGNELARAARSHGWPVVLHLSGGFKAAIPYLLVMAEGIRTRLQPAKPDLDVTAVCIHESSIQTGNPTLVPLPVRYLSGSVRKALQAPDALDDGDLRGQFTLDPTAGEPARFSWAGLILTDVLAGWP